jgi:O-antigen ligase
MALLLHTGWFAVSTLQAVSVPVATAALIELLKILLPFLVGVTLLTKEAQARTLLWVIVGAQAYVGYDLNMSYLRGTNVAQAQGFGGMDNNSLGISLVASVGVAVGLLLSARRPVERLAAASAVLVILHTVLLTFSRGAMVGLIAAGVTAALLMPKRPRYVVALVVALAVVIRLTGPELSARFQSAFVEGDDRDASAESRVELWKDCLDVAATHPLFGVGPKNWPVIAADYGWPPGKEAHSVWMQTLAEVGFPGVIALVAMYAIACVKLWSMLRRRRSGEITPPMTMSLGIIISIIGFAVSAQFVSLQGLEVPFYIVAGAVVLLKQATASAAGTANPKSTPRDVQKHGGERPSVHRVRAGLDHEAPGGRTQPRGLLRIVEQPPDR